MVADAPSEDLDPAVDRVAALAGEGDPGSILVLRGIVGTGRHEALARGIARALADRAEPPRLTIHCPDDAVGCQVAREFLAQGITASYDLVVGTGDGSIGGGQPLRHPPVDHRNEVVVLCELQRFESETRYRIAQTGRGPFPVIEIGRVVQFLVNAVDQVAVEPEQLAGVYFRYYPLLQEAYEEVRKLYDLKSVFIRKVYDDLVMKQMSI